MRAAHIRPGPERQRVSYTGRIRRSVTRRCLTRPQRRTRHTGPPNPLDTYLLPSQAQNSGRKGASQHQDSQHPRANPFHAAGRTSTKKDDSSITSWRSLPRGSAVLRNDDTLAGHTRDDQARETPVHAIFPGQSSDGAVTPTLS